MEGRGGTGLEFKKRGVRLLRTTPGKNEEAGGGRCSFERKDIQISLNKKEDLPERRGR